MTGEEMERAIEFLLQSHANFDSRIGGLTVRMEALTQNVEDLTQNVEVLTQNVEVLTQNVEENTRQIAQINKQIEVLADSHNDLMHIVIRLADTVERFISGSGNGHERR